MKISISGNFLLWRKLPPQFLKAMKLTAIFLLAFFMQISAKSFSQVTLSLKNASIEKVFREVERQTGVGFLYTRKMVKGLPRVTVDVKNTSVEELLNECFKGQPLEYSIDKNTIVINRKIERPESIIPVQLLSPEPALPLPPPIEIHGSVTDEQGNALANVSVVVVGTSVGTTTNADGRFSITAPDNRNVSLEFSSVGFVARRVEIGSQTEVNVVLAQDVSGLDEVVVTALGIQKERRALGYSVTGVSSEELTNSRDVNMMNTLVGKVAGLNVSSIAGGPGASSNVIIRGISSLNQSNQPLYVINGIPIESQPRSLSGAQGAVGPDLGDDISNLNPDDIESISVLKGAAASALYGYRAKAGVILITTKSGRNQENSVELNSNFVAESVVNLTDFQYEYGQGVQGRKPVSQGDAYQNGQMNYGAKLDGSMVVQFDGVERPYIAQKNNFKNFYRTGGTFTNTIAFNKSFDDGGSIRFSASDLANTSILPSSSFGRQSFDLSLNYNVTDHLLLDVRTNYILEKANNRAVIGDFTRNAGYSLKTLPTSLDVRTLEKMTNEDGSEYTFSSNIWATNPWFAAKKQKYNTKRNRSISSIMLRYQFGNGGFIQGRTGYDAYTNQYLRVSPTGIGASPTGSMTVQNRTYSDLNVDALAGKDFVINQFTVTPTIGASFRRSKSEEYSNGGTIFTVPFVYNVLNLSSKTLTYTPSDQEVQSIYGTLSADYKRLIYLNASLRNDWFSTLASPLKTDKLNALYPSFSGSFVFSDLLKNQEWLDFGKIRSGYAIVGQATSPYQTSLSYSFLANQYKGHQLGNITNASVPNAELIASKAKEFEVGIEMGLLKNLVNVDIAWYHKRSSNEIVSAPASLASGYNSAVLNLGELQNTGLEVLFKGFVVRNKSFRWSVGLNGAINENKVLKLAGGQGSMRVGTSRLPYGFIENIVGLPANQVMAYDYLYDDRGNIVVDGNGIPSRGPLIPMGSSYSKWLAGITNEISFKNFRLSFLVDGKFGGKIFSASNLEAYLLGLHKATLVGRDGMFGPNQDVYPETYYYNFILNVSKFAVEDASFIKFREINLRYKIPSSVLKNSKLLKEASLSLVGRNLFFLLRKSENIDPEGVLTPNAFGLEYGELPGTRAYGLNLNIKF